MERKTARLSAGALFGAMVLFVSLVLYGFMYFRPDLYLLAKQIAPVMLLGGVGLLGLGWVVTVGLFFGQGWARTLAGLYAAVFLIVDYFLVTATVSQPNPGMDPADALKNVGLLIIAEVVVAVWGLTLLYFFLSPSESESPPSALSVEVLNTK